MNKITYVAVAALLILLLAGIASAAPPAPVPQQLGFTDTQFSNIQTPTCRNCHAGQPTAMKPYPANNLHHVMISKGTTTLGCPDCHAANNAIIEGNCVNCHNGTGWYQNPSLNLSVIRGLPGRPHHNTAKNSSSNLAIQAKDMAASRNCRGCHGDANLDNYNDGHEVRYLTPQLVSVFADYKLTNATTGVKWGGCLACHDTNASDPTSILKNNHDTHHYETTDMKGRQCNYCHVSFGPSAEPNPDFSPEPNGSPFRLYLNDSSNWYYWVNYPYENVVDNYGWDNGTHKHTEVNNRSLMFEQYAGRPFPDTVNATGCTKCHSYRDLHNIEGPSPLGDAAYNIANDIAGYGHVGAAADCNGCHEPGTFTPTNDERPIIAPLTVTLDSVDPAEVVAGQATDLTLTGSGFDQDASGYTTTVILDGQSLTPTSKSGTQIVLASQTLTAGAHSIQVDVSGQSSAVLTVVAQEPVAITSATLTSGTLDIVGSKFGTTQMQLVIKKADGSTSYADSFSNWADTAIQAASAAAAVGDEVTVVTGDGSATATIVAGVSDSITVGVPNGGENWKRGTTQTIQWSSTGNPGANVKIQLKKGTSSPTTIVSSTANDGSYSWRIPGSQSTGSNYVVIITSTSNPQYTDTSDATFTISK